MASQDPAPAGPSWTESERLAALRRYGVLDTPGELEFDDIVRLAAHACDAPVAVVNLIDETRQWFKAELGLGVRETPLNVSICAKAILQSGLVVVPDLRNDPRFEHNPLVTGEPNLRFYAGVVLETAEGLPLGTLCILDYKPRELTEQQALMLRALARQVMTQLDLRLALRRQRESEARTRLILESATDYAIIAMDLEGAVTSWNEGARRILGWSEEEVVGQPGAVIFTPEDRARGAPAEEMRTALKAGRAMDERWHMRRDGSRFWASGELTPLSGEQDAPIGFLKILRDRTEQRVREQQAAVATRKLLEEGERLQQLFRQAPGFMAVLRGREHIFELANDAYQDLVGRSDIIGLPVRDVLPELEGQGFFDLLDTVYASGVPFVGRNMRVVLSGRPGQAERFVDFVYQPILAADGSVSGIFVEGSDVTERARAEAALAGSEERLRIAQRAGGIGAFEWEPDSVALTVSEEFCRVFGIETRAEVPFEEVFRIVHPDDREFVSGFRRRFSGDTLDYAEYRIIRPDTGETRWIARRGEVLRQHGDGRIRGVGVIYDVTESKRAEQAVRDLNESLARLVAERTRERDRMWQLSKDLMAVAREDGTIVSVNAAWTEMLGWQPAALLGTRLFDVVHPDDLASTKSQIERLKRGRSANGFENRLRRSDGSYRLIAWTAVPEEGLSYAVGRDITGQRATEEALRQSQKMEAVGQLTGGIAHDFNNMLTGILGSLDLMQTRIAQGRSEQIGRYAQAAMSSAQRAAALTHRLLAFARRQPLDPKPVSANALIASMEDLLRRTIGETIALEIVMAGGLWTTLCDPHQLESAILNLAINARDAMPEGGRLTIETANAHLDQAYAAAQRDVTPGQYVVICVTDTGSGMPPEVIARAFDPFFTTKPIGQGTGLGLSMVYGFAKQSEGHVRIYSEPDQGTTVKIYLPRHAGEAQAERPSAGEAAPLRAEAGETVLVVEDDLVVRGLIVEVLEDLGYGALEAGDGTAGLRILQSQARVDLLVTDVGLPGLNGRQLADQARASRPGLKVLFITGYAENAAVANGFLDPGMEMITKPFAVEALARRIREMIEQD